MPGVGGDPIGQRRHQTDAQRRLSRQQMRSATADYDAPSQASQRHDRLHQVAHITRLTQGVADKRLDALEEPALRLLMEALQQIDSKPFLAGNVFE